MKFLLPLLCLCLARAAVAAGLEWSLVHDGQPVFAGEAFRVKLLVVNAGASAEDATLPEQVAARLTRGAATQELVLRAAEAGGRQVQLAPGAFAQRAYTGVLPRDALGVLQLELPALQSNRLTLAGETARLAPVAAAAAGDGEAPARPAKGAGRGDPEPALSAYEPMYFIVGTRGGNSAKFQLSFKYQLFDPRGVVADFLPAVSRLYFGYTQTSIWDLGRDSKPFRDTSYRPALFYEWRDLWPWPQEASTLDLRLGLEHESNGRDSASSRSINTAFIRPEWRTVLRDSHYLALAPRAWLYLDREDNPDIARYRGYADVSLRYGRIDGWQWAALLRHGTGGSSSVQLDGSYPLRRPLFANVGGYLHFQYFNGYGESFLDYNLKRRSQFRIGFSIVR